MPVDIELDGDERPEHAIVDGRRIIVLAHPFEYGRNTITELKMRAEGQLGDLEGVSMGHIDGGTVQFSQLIAIAGNMCGKPLPLIRQLRGVDQTEVMHYAWVFFQKSLEMFRNG